MSDIGLRLRTFRIVLVFAFLLSIVARASAQGVAADLSGTIRDTSGAVVGGALVKVLSTETARVRIVKADADGRYSVPVLPAGDYEITVSADGFGVASRAVRLAVG